MDKISITKPQSINDKYKLYLDKFHKCINQMSEEEVEGVYNTLKKVYKIIYHKEWINEKR